MEESAFYNSSRKCYQLKIFHEGSVFIPTDVDDSRPVVDDNNVQVQLFFEFVLGHDNGPAQFPHQRVLSDFAVDERIEFWALDCGLMGYCGEDQLLGCNQLLDAFFVVV